MALKSLFASVSLVLMSLTPKEISVELEKELEAMSTIASALDGLGEGEEATRARIVQWLAARYGTKIVSSPAAGGPTEPVADAGTVTGAGGSDFDTVADLFHAASPTTNGERALVVSHWVTEYEEKPEFGSQEINATLKDLGHGIKNITEAFSSLMKRSPALVMQTRKTGKGPQARKKYKLTVAGQEEVRRMIQRVQESGD